MICYDEEFKPVKDHDLLDPAVELIRIDRGTHMFRCLLCSVTETRYLPADLILVDDVALQGGARDLS